MVSYFQSDRDIGGTSIRLQAKQSNEDSPDASSGRGGTRARPRLISLYVVENDAKLAIESTSSLAAWGLLFAWSD